MYCLGYANKQERSQTYSSAELREICKAGHEGQSSRSLQSSKPAALPLAEGLCQCPGLPSIQHL